MKKDVFLKIKKELVGIQKNISLAKYTTFRIGGRAKYFFVAKKKEDIISALLVVKKYNLPFFILGGGSNLLVADKGFGGLVIKCQMSNIKCQNSKIKTESGTPLGLAVSEAKKNSLTGLEWAIGIPGTVGGAVFGNAGAFGRSIADVIEKVEVFDLKNKKIKTLKKIDCKFSYRESIFKKNKNLIILTIILKLKKEKKSKIKKKIKNYLNYRKKTQPLNFPSIGSIFKNPKSKIQNLKLLKKYPELKKFNKKGEIPAAFLIERCNLKGKKIGKAQISKKHANFIVNLGGASAKDVKELIELAKKNAKEIFKIQLEEEIQYLGF